MAADINDNFRKTFNSENPNVTFVSSPRTALATTLTCDSLTGWPTDTAVDLITYKLDTDGETVIPGSQTDWKGIVSGNTVTELTRVAGAADAGNDVNDIVEMTPTGSWGNDLIEGVLVSHNQDGTLKDDIVTTAKIDDGAVTSPKLNLSKTTDANGWTVYDYGNWKEYRKRWTWSESSITANSGRIFITGQALPVGVSTLDDVFLASTATINGSGYGTGYITVNGDASDSTIEAYIYNNSASSRTWAGILDITMTSK